MILIKAALRHHQKSLGTLLRQWRKSAGLTQEQVRQQLGYESPQIISNWERGVATPSIQHLRRIIEIYAVPKKRAMQSLLNLDRNYLKKTLLR